MILPLNWWHSWTYFKCHWSIYLTKPHEVESRCTRISHACCIFSSPHSFWKHSWNFLARNVLFNACVVSAVQVVMQLVRLLPDGHRMKREVDMALDSVSETMTPMHYHLREIIISKYRQVQHISIPKKVCCHFYKYADKYCWLMTAGIQSSAIMESAAVPHEPHRWHQLLFQMSLSCSLDPSEIHCSGYRRCSLWKMIVVQDNLSHKAREFQAWPCFVCDPHNIKLHVTSISAALFLTLNMFNAWWDGALQILLFNILQL